MVKLAAWLVLVRVLVAPVNAAPELPIVPACTVGALIVPLALIVLVVVTVAPVNAAPALPMVPALTVGAEMVLYAATVPFTTRPVSVPTLVILV